MPKKAMFHSQNNQNGGLCLWDYPQSRPLFGKNVTILQILSKIQS
jgi:hypothetical protein